MNYINPDPEQKIIELEEVVSAQDVHLQDVETENGELLSALKAMLGWYESGNHVIPQAVVIAAKEAVVKAELQ